MKQIRQERTNIVLFHMYETSRTDTFMRQKADYKPSGDRERGKIIGKKQCVHGDRDALRILVLVAVCWEHTCDHIVH